MKKINGLVAVSMLSVALVACGTGADSDTATNTEQTSGTSDMMGGGEEEPNPNLGTATGQDLEEVDVQRTPNMQESNEDMTGAEDIAEQDALSE